MRFLIHRMRLEFMDIRFARFLVFGCMTAAVNLIVGGVLYSHDATEKILPYWAAVTIAGILAMIVGFLLNSKLNFRYEGRSAFAQFRTYILIASSCIVLTTVMAEVGVQLFDHLFEAEGFMLGPQYISYEFASHFCAVGSIAIYSYIAHKYLTFDEGIRERIRALRSKNSS
ncbi:MAG: GtrA family protein [Rhodospirillales bacterium]|nr:GtrA family protein [Rhodospirillales bacterium]